MQIKQFMQMAKAGALKKVTVTKRDEGYSLVAETSEATEILRTQAGHPRVFSNWETLMGKLDEAQVKCFTVLN